jgi:type IV secretory pathway TrbL component
LSEPKINIVIGMIVSVGQGSLLPIFGIFMGKMLFVLQWLPLINDYPKIRADSNFYCLMMLILAIVSFGTATTQKFSFGYIGENVTMKIRK